MYKKQVEERINERLRMKNDVRITRKPKKNILVRQGNERAGTRRGNG